MCLNLMDEAKAHRIEIDVRSLARDLGITVVPCSARSGDGIPELLAEISRMARDRQTPAPYPLDYNIPGLRSALRQVESALKDAFPELLQTRWVALRLLEGDRQIIDAVHSGEIGTLHTADDAQFNGAAT